MRGGWRLHLVRVTRGWGGGEAGWGAAFEFRPHKHTSYTTPPPRLASRRANVTLAHQPSHWHTSLLTAWLAAEWLCVAPLC